MRSVLLIGMTFLLGTTVSGQNKFEFIPDGGVLTIYYKNKTMTDNEIWDLLEKSTNKEVVALSTQSRNQVFLGNLLKGEAGLLAAVGGFGMGVLAFAPLDRSGNAEGLNHLKWLSIGSLVGGVVLDLVGGETLKSGMKNRLIAIEQFNSHTSSGSVDSAARQ